MHKVFCFLMGFLCSPALPSQEYCGAIPFYDATLYQQKTDEIAEYLSPITVIYGHLMYRDRKPASKLPDADFARNHVKQQLVRGSNIIVYDVEHWPIRGFYNRPWKRSQNVAKYKEFLQMVGDWVPEKQIGYFGMFPLNDYAGIKDSTSSKRYKWWQEDNEATSPLEPDVDIFFPSFYTYNENIEEWRLVAMRKIEQSRAMNPEKKILPFVWPQYFDHKPAPTNLQNKYMPADQWITQLEFLMDKVDGVIIWGGYDLVKNRPFLWNREAEWWTATKDLMRRQHRDGNCMSERAIAN